MGAVRAKGGPVLSSERDYRPVIRTIGWVREAFLFVNDNGTVAVLVVETIIPRSFTKIDSNKASTTDRGRRRSCRRA